MYNCTLHIVQFFKMQLCVFVTPIDSFHHSVSKGIKIQTFNNF